MGKQFVGRAALEKIVDNVRKQTLKGGVNQIIGFDKNGNQVLKNLTISSDTIKVDSAGIESMKLSCSSGTSGAFGGVKIESGYQSQSMNPIKIAGGTVIGDPDSTSSYNQDIKIPFSFDTTDDIYGFKYKDGNTYKTLRFHASTMYPLHKECTASSIVGSGTSWSFCVASGTYINGSWQSGDFSTNIDNEMNLFHNSFNKVCFYGTITFTGNSIDESDVTFGDDHITYPINMIMNHSPQMTTGSGGVTCNYDIIVNGINVTKRRIAGFYGGSSNFLSFELVNDRYSGPTLNVKTNLLKSGYTALLDGFIYYII